MSEDEILKAAIAMSLEEHQEEEDENELLQKAIDMSLD